MVSRPPKVSMRTTLGATRLTAALMAFSSRRARSSAACIDAVITPRQTISAAKNNGAAPQRAATEFRFELPIRCSSVETSLVIAHRRAELLPLTRLIAKALAELRRPAPDG